jgi:Rieske Fe-S protein
MPDPVEVLERLRGHRFVRPPTVDDIAARAGRRRRRRRLVLATTLALTLTPALLAVTTLRRDDSAEVLTSADETLSLARIPEGVSARVVDGVPLFIVRRGDHVTAFLARTNHLSGEQLWWCPAEGVFASPAHSEIYTEDGVAIGGPAPRGLDRAAVTVRGATVHVNPHLVSPGPWRWEQGAQAQTPPSTSVGDDPAVAWSSGFCRDPVKAPVVHAGTAAAPDCPDTGPPAATTFRVKLPDGQVFTPSGVRRDDRALAAPGGPLQLEVESVVDPSVRLLRLEYVVGREGAPPFRTLADRADVVGTARTDLAWDLRLGDGSPAPPGRYEVVALTIIGADDRPCGAGPGTSESVRLGSLVVPGPGPG